MAQTSIKNNERIHPEFPEFCDGIRPVRPMPGGRLGSIIPIACIPTYTFYPEGSKKFIEGKEAYIKEKQKEYEEIKAIYDKNCFVGTVFKGNTDVTARITKIAITTERAYVCYRPTEEHIKAVEEENKTRSVKIQPLSPGRFGLNAFLSAIALNQVKIISIPQ